MLEFQTTFVPPNVATRFLEPGFSMGSPGREALLPKGP
jgi:hypothetical protein